MEPNELALLKVFILKILDAKFDQATIAMEFLTKAYSGFKSEKIFITKILKGERQRPNIDKRRILCNKHNTGFTLMLMLDLLTYINHLEDILCKFKDSVSALKCILEEHIVNGSCLKILYANEIAKRKYSKRGNFFRCVGSTLLVKGLEFDHAIILRGEGWGTAKDLYVALTRGAKSVTLLEITK